MKNNYTMLELVIAFVLLAVLSSCFIASLHTLYEADRLFVAESRATLALDNTLERFAASGDLSAKNLQRLFDLEYAKSPFSASNRFRKSFELRDGAAFLRVESFSGKALAEVKIKCKE